VSPVKFFLTNAANMRKDAIMQPQAETEYRRKGIRVTPAFDDAVSEIVFIRERFIDKRRVTRQDAIASSVMETASRLREKYPIPGVR
jgi:hypothetical protein